MVADLIVTLGAWVGAGALIGLIVGLAIAVLEGDR